MDYEELKREARRGSADAANQLLELARERRDEKTLLVVWGVTHRTRFTAWKALRKSIIAAGLDSSAADYLRKPSLNTTSKIRDNLVARALVEASEKTHDGKDERVDTIIELAYRLLERRNWRPTDEFMAEFEKRLGDLMFSPDEEAGGVARGLLMMINDVGATGEV